MRERESECKREKVRRNICELQYGKVNNSVADPTLEQEEEKCFELEEMFLKCGTYIRW